MRAEPHAPPSTMPAVDAVMRPLVDSGALPGYVTLALRDGRVVHSSAYGKANLATGAPARQDTIFRIYSMTKPIQAVAMMILYEEGHWRPDDPIAKFLPEFAEVKVYRGKDPAGRPTLTSPASPPTMGQLMTHTAGLGYGITNSPVDELYRAARLSEAASPDDYVRRLAALPLAYDPGTRWEYSVAMDVQGRIVERITGQSLGAFMRERIFAPLGMTDTGFYVDPAKRDRMAVVYRMGDQGRLEPPPTPIDTHLQPPRVESGGGGLFSTALDYARFGQMLLNEGELDGVRILRPDSVRLMMSNQVSPQIIAGGFGIGVQRIRPGYEFGYNGVVVTDPQAAKAALGKGSYLWDGAAGTWFWVDPANRIVFVGMIQRMSGPGSPRVQASIQAAVAESLAGSVTAAR